MWVRKTLARRLPEAWPLSRRASLPSAVCVPTRTIRSVLLSPKGYPTPRLRRFKIDAVSLGRAARDTGNGCRGRSGGDKGIEGEGDGILERRESPAQFSPDGSGSGEIERNSPRS